MKVRKVLLCLITAVVFSAAVFGCGKTRLSKAKGVTTAESEAGKETAGMEFGKTTEPADTTTQASEEVVVSITIDGSKGEDKAISCNKDLKLTSGSTAYDALAKLCDMEGYEITGDPSYVKTIGGLGEGSFGAKPCGWMFMVNGDYPSKPANEFVLEDGSQLTWEFVK